MGDMHRKIKPKRDDYDNYHGKMDNLGLRKCPKLLGVYTYITNQDEHCIVRGETIKIE